ncbi:MAG TPA: hypothetical protein VFW17_09285 [Ktedonobacterales bacterium]|nr:hypothetical protein [Ktedonobacterales bacterium]
MGTVIHTRAVVGPDGTIEIRAPELAPGQEVEVTVEVQTAPETGRHVSEIIKDLPGHLEFQTAEEVDAYIREERDSWDR